MVREHRLKDFELGVIRFSENADGKMLKLSAGRYTTGVLQLVRMNKSCDHLHGTESTIITGGSLLATHHCRHAMIIIFPGHITRWKTNERSSTLPIHTEISPAFARSHGILTRLI